MLDRLEDRLLLSADGSFPPAVDTNQDGLFEPFDALILLNAVNHHTSAEDAPQLDLNGDGQLSTADVDLIIGSLNSYYGGDWDAESIAALDDVTLAISDTVVSEGAAADVTVSLVQPSSEPVEVMVWSEGGTAHAYEDFEATYVYLLFEPGGPTSQTVSVATMLDGVNEGDETFLMRASRTGGTTPAEAVATVTLHDVQLDLPSLSITGSPVHEGDSATVTLTLDSTPATDLFITVWTADGTATGYEDYESLSTDYYWIAGDPLSQTFTIPTVADSVSEGDEAFTVYAGVGLIGGTTSPVESSGSVTILDGDSGDSTGDPAGNDPTGNDPTGDAPTLTVSDVTVSEGAATAVTVTLSSPPSDPLSLYIGSESITATEGSDYDYVFDFLTFEPDGPLTQTVAVPTLGDNEAEDDETFRVVVTNSMSYESVTGTVTITDIAPPTVTVSDTTVLEGEVATVTVSLSSSPAVPLSVNVWTQSGTAWEYDDFEYLSSWVSFEPDGPLTQTVTIAAYPDNQAEGQETFTLQVGEYDNSTSGTVTITDVASQTPETCSTAQPSLPDGILTAHENAESWQANNFPVATEGEPRTAYSSVPEPWKSVEVSGPGLETKTFLTGEAVVLTFDDDQPPGTPSDLVTITATWTHNCGLVRSTETTYSVANVAPIANDDTEVTGEDDIVYLDRLLANDTDVSVSDSLNLSIAWASETGTSGGRIRQDTNGRYYYDPRGVFDHLGSGEEATDTFTYKVQDDDSGVSEPATATIVILGVPEAYQLGVEKLSDANEELQEPAQFRLTLDRPATMEISISYSIADLVELLVHAQPSDIENSAGTLTFAPGETEKELRLVPTEDAIVELNETSVVKLEAVSAQYIVQTNPLGHNFRVLDNEWRWESIPFGATNLVETAERMDGPGSGIGGIDSEITGFHYVRAEGNENDPLQGPNVIDQNCWVKLDGLGAGAVRQIAHAKLRRTFGLNPVSGSIIQATGVLGFGSDSESGVFYDTFAAVRDSNMQILTDAAHRKVVQLDVSAALAVDPNASVEFGIGPAGAISVANASYDHSFEVHTVQLVALKGASN